ncbi:unnamed protein product [Nesidiocoris tenuis]|uniref:Uncharacterized protein n=1 Tax=Nesidiocoris tenuis TaxID=355587 RepID=A0A6H5GYL0_9HEMI|nr:unnamed protein product [Nesidiocoris tenuis]
MRETGVLESWRCERKLRSRQCNARTLASEDGTDRPVIYQDPFPLPRILSIGRSLTGKGETLKTPGGNSDKK